MDAFLLCILKRRMTSTGVNRTIYRELKRFGPWSCDLNGKVCFRDFEQREKAWSRYEILFYKSRIKEIVLECFRYCNSKLLCNCLTNDIAYTRSLNYAYHHLFCRV